MPRHDGHTRRTNRKKHGGHKMHKRSKAQKQALARYPKRQANNGT